MKQERVILSFIMVLVGLIVAGSVFYFYQSEKHVPTKPQALVSPTPRADTNKTTIFLNLTNLNNEAVVSNKTLTLNGTTNPQATVIIITKADQQVFKPTSDGTFNATITLENDQNLITVISVLPNGENRQIQRTVTYSTSTF